MTKSQRRRGPDLTVRISAAPVRRRRITRRCPPKRLASARGLLGEDHLLPERGPARRRGRPSSSDLGASVARWSAAATLPCSATVWPACAGPGRRRPAGRRRPRCRARRPSPPASLGLDEVGPVIDGGMLPCSMTVRALSSTLAGRPSSRSAAIDKPATAANPRPAPTQTRAASAAAMRTRVSRAPARWATRRRWSGLGRQW